MEPVVPSVLHDEENGDVHGHLPKRREGDSVLHAEVGRYGMEEPDLGQLHGEVAKQDERGALPLLLPGRDFLLFRES